MKLDTAAPHRTTSGMASPSGLSGALPVCALLLGALALASGPWVLAASAQEPRVMRAAEPPPLRGRVVTEVEGTPVPRVRLNFTNGATALTDEAGRFTVAGLPLGEHRVTLVTPTCRAVRGLVRVVEGMDWETQLSLPEALADPTPGPDFEAGQGKFLTETEIQAARARTVVDLIRRLAPEMVDPAGNQPGEVTGLRGRNTATLGGHARPILVLDGIPQSDAAGVLRDLRPDDLAGIQVLPGASGAWVYGTSGGMVRVWTKRGRGAGSVGGPPDCPAYRGPGGV